MVISMVVKKNSDFFNSFLKSRIYFFCKMDEYKKKNIKKKENEE